jgi:dihydrofolate reductase
VKSSVFVGTSLDGFIAREDGSFDFLPQGGGEEHGYAKFFASVQALLLGRKTYETALGFKRWPYGKKPVFVLSSRPLAPAPRGARVEHLSGSPEGVWTVLESRGIEHVYVDGGATIQAFLNAGLIQHLTITRVPVLIGRGISLFGPTMRDIPLEHVRTRSYASGLVTSEYEAIRADEDAPPERRRGRATASRARRAAGRASRALRSRPRSG